MYEELSKIQWINNINNTLILLLQPPHEDTNGKLI